MRKPAKMSKPTPIAPAPAAPVAPAAALALPPPPAAMTSQVAISNLVSVARAYKGTKDEHDILEQSLATIAATLNDNLKQIAELKAAITPEEEAAED